MPNNPDKREHFPLEWWKEQVDRAKRHLGIESWDIVVTSRPNFRGKEGHALTRMGQKRATLTFREDALPGTALKTVYHEMLHVATAPWWDLMEQVIDRMVPKELQAQARKAIIPGEEYVIESLAHAFEKLVKYEQEMREIAKDN